MSTEAEAFTELHKRDLLGEAVFAVESVIDKGIEQHLIAANISKGTFTADKVALALFRSSS